MATAVPARGWWPVLKRTCAESANDNLLAGETAQSTLPPSEAAKPQTNAKQNKLLLTIMVTVLVALRRVFLRREKELGGG